MEFLEERKEGGAEGDFFARLNFLVTWKTARLILGSKNAEVAPVESLHETPHRIRTGEAHGKLPLKRG